MSIKPLKGPDGKTIQFLKDTVEIQDYVIHLGAEIWAASTAYVKEQLIRAPDGCVYQANESHTSGSTFVSDKAKWEEDTRGLYLDDEGSEVLTAVDSPVIRNSANAITSGDPDLEEASPTRS